MKATAISKFTEQYESAPVIHAPQFPRNGERTQEIYAARGGMMGMTLNDWLKAEQELDRVLEKQTNHTNKREKIMTAAQLDLTLDIFAEDGSRTRFYQNDGESVSKALGQLVSPRLFNQPLLTLASEHSVSAIPGRTIDLIQAHTASPVSLPLPPGWLDAVETDGDAFLDVADPGESPAAQDNARLLVEIHTLGDWMVRLKLETTNHATLQEQRQFLGRFFDLPVIPFRLRTGGVGFINPAKIVRVTVQPPINGVAETALPADLLQSIRS